MNINSKFIKIESDVAGTILADYIDNAQIWTGNTVVASDTLNDVDKTKLTELPETGWVEKGLYLYENKAIYCNQPHNRTIYAPELTPALFSFFRENSDTLSWIANENVKLGWKRMHNGVQYVVVIPHMTLEGWEPYKTLGNLWSEVQEPTEIPPQWNTANWSQYVVGYRVVDSGKIWEAINTTHTWIQPALSGNGAISWKYIADV